MLHAIETAEFMARVKEWLSLEGRVARVIQLPKNQHVYTYGEQGDAAYLVETGQVKLLIPTLDGEEGLVDVCSTGDMFGEACLFHKSMRGETAVSMSECAVLSIPFHALNGAALRCGLLDALCRYALGRVSDQQELIAALSAVRKEHRLALTLLYLARRIGKQESSGTCIGQRLAQEELAEMTGMRRTRVGMFLRKFQDMGMIRRNELGHVIILPEEFGRYLAEAELS